MKTHYDYLIIGAGPAGVQLGYFLEKNNRDYLIVDRADGAGAFFRNFPRHRLLISINKVYTGTDNWEANYRWDWNSLICDNEELLFKNYTKKYFPDASILPKYMQDFADHYQLNIKYNTTVTAVKKNEEDHFVLIDSDGNELTSKRLIVATGIFKPYIPNIPGVELCENYVDHDIDPEKYANKRVLVVGKGNSAFETADNLVETTTAIHVCSPDPVKFAWQTHYVGHLRAINNNFLDTYQLKSQNTVIDATINKIEKDGDQLAVHLSYTHASGQTAVVKYDNVIFCTGFRFDNSIYEGDCKPALMHMDKFPAQTSEWESENVQDMYFAGTLMQACDYKKTMSGFIHGFRQNVQVLANILELKYHDKSLPSDALEATPEAVTNHVIDRVNHGASMFLQPAFLCDAMVVDEETKTVQYYDNLRLEYVPDSELSKQAHYYTISLEYGHFMGNPFAIERDPDPEQAVHAAYLHPVIRRFSYGELVAEHHVHDDLESQWYKEEYVQPALAWFKEQLAPEAEAEMVMG